MLHEESRRYLVTAYENNPTLEQANRLAETFHVSARRVYQLVAEYRKTGTCKEHSSNSGRKSKISKNEAAQIDILIQGDPDITLQEIHDAMGLTCCIATIDNIVTEKLGYSRKKKMIHASEQDRPRCAGKEKRVG